MARCDSYDFGQCTWGACELAPWCPERLGNGGDWAASARALGYEVTMTPTVGALVCYLAGDGYSQYGHCAVCTAVYADGTFEVREMNYAAYDEYDDRRSNTYDLGGFILPPGVSPGAGGGAGAGPGGGGDTIMKDAWANVTTAWHAQIPGMLNQLMGASGTSKTLW